MAFQVGRRTEASNLTDSELIIIDIAAMYIAQCSQYRDSTFAAQWNCPSHGFDDRTLLMTLDRFESEGLITSEACYDLRGRPDRTVQLTAAGGDLWESERRPDWMQYVTDIHPRNRISIYGFSMDACERFFRVACDASLINYDGGRIRRAVADRQLIYWRPPQRVHLLCAPVVDETPGTFLNTNWSYFESRRSWWRFPHEIATFWPYET